MLFFLILDYLLPRYDDYYVHPEYQDDFHKRSPVGGKYTFSNWVLFSLIRHILLFGEHSLQLTAFIFS